MIKKPYNQTDHYHYWESKTPPCGQKIEHLKCCLCELPNPKTYIDKSNFIAEQIPEWEKEFDQIYFSELDGGYVERRKLLKDLISHLLTTEREKAFEAGISTGTVEGHRDGFKDGQQAAYAQVR